MDDPDKHPDRTKQLHSLSQAIARGASQVLQSVVRNGAPPSPQLSKIQIRSAGDGLGSPEDMTARCECCGKAMGPGRSDKLFCSRECLMKDYQAVVSAARREARAGRSCEWCGGAISDDKRSSARFCCRSCCMAAYNFAVTRRGHIAHCVECARPLHRSSHANRKFCNTTCRIAHQPKIPCKHCGQLFNRKVRRQRYCGLSCAGKANLKGRIIWPTPRRYGLTPARFDALMAA